jgi:hypothetical protein
MLISDNGRTSLLVSLLVLLHAAVALGQTAALGGIVKDSVGAGLSGVEVRVLGTQARATSDAEGRFRLQGLIVGRVTLQARRVGLRPAEVAVDLDPAREAAVTIRMLAEGVTLPDIEVRGRSEKPVKYAGTTKYDGFFRRQRAGFGTFISREQIEKMNVFHAVEILRSIPGVNVTFREADPITARVRVQRCSGPGANIDVYVDGRLQMARDSVAIPGGGVGSRVSVALAGISAPHIEMVEIFRGAAEIPGEYDGGNACAIIAIWTRWSPP